MPDSSPRDLNRTFKYYPFLRLFKVFYTQFFILIWIQIVKKKLECILYVYSSCTVSAYCLNNPILFWLIIWLIRVAITRSLSHNIYVELTLATTSLQKLYISTLPHLLSYCTTSLPSTTTSELLHLQHLQGYPIFIRHQQSQRFHFLKATISSHVPHLKATNIFKDTTSTKSTILPYLQTYQISSYYIFKATVLPLL